MLWNLKNNPFAINRTTLLSVFLSLHVSHYSLWSSMAQPATDDLFFYHDLSLFSLFFLS